MSAQRTAERKRKLTVVLANVASGEDPNAAAGAWGPAVQRGAKMLSSHEELTDEQKEYIAWHNARREARSVRQLARVFDGAVLTTLPAQKKPVSAETEHVEEPEAEPDTGGEKTHFHGKSEVDYAGNSWLEPPKDKKKQGDECFLPKRWVHTWRVSARSVNMQVFSRAVLLPLQEWTLQGRGSYSVFSWLWPSAAVCWHG
jgi:pre-mRNA-processing factor 17